MGILTDLLSVEKISGIAPDLKQVFDRIRFLKYMDRIAPAPISID